MNKAELFCSMILVQMVFSSIDLLNEQEQLRITEIQIQENEFEENTCFQIGLFSKYNPLGNVLQIGRVGIFDSNCFHLFSITDQSTSSLNLIYYDCIVYESKQIKKRIEFITYEGLQINKDAIIETYKYENTWHYFQILQCYDNLQIQILEFGQQNLLELITNTKYPFTSTDIILTFGGGLIVSNSLIHSIEVGRKFSFFPGKLYLINYSLVQFNSKVNLIISTFEHFFMFSICNCVQNYPKTIADVDIKWLQQEMFTISYANCDSFIFAGWFRIQEIIQIDQEFTYHFFKLKANFENQQLSNQNLSPLQLYYKITPLSNQIIITTYSYTFPSVNIDFSDDPFLITRILDIQNNIRLWHNIFVQLSQQQISVKLNFFEQNNIYPYDMYIDVHQFTNVQFKLYYGNLQQNSKNYLNFQVRNIVFLNCDDQFQQQNCHFSCETCDGPTSTDCITCSESSKRLYISSFKSCICPYGMIDKNEHCFSYLDYNFQIKQDWSQEFKCQFGYFELDENCIKCPSLISEKQLTCLECLNNPTSWQQNSNCETILMLDTRNTAKTFAQKQIYYKYDGDGLQACLYCDQTNLQIEEEQQEELELILNNLFISFCWKSFNYQVQQYKCYECPFQFCLECQMLETGGVCLKCYFPYYLENGICTSKPPNTLELNECLSPYYITSNKECKPCPIDKCKYCFEFYTDDLSKCTLYQDFISFPLNEYLKIGCALCEDGYIFNFLTYLCEYQKPNTNNCLRAFIHENGNEICILSSSDNFSVAPEIINCEKYIQNCLQCILTKYFVIKCIVCKSEYTSSSLGGFCKKSILKNSKISVEGDTYKQDGWVQLIQSFMMSFLPNQYYYPFGTKWQIQEMSIQCQDGYARNPFGKCLKSCDQNCEQCIFQDRSIQGERYECQTCPLNYYQQPIMVQISGKCVQCSQLCQVCSFRSNEEIQIINPNFLVDDQNKIYLMKCIKQISDPKIYLNPYLQLARYCFEDNCRSQLSIDIGDLFCLQCTWEIYEDQFINYEYCNEMGVTVINIIRQYEKNDLQVGYYENQFFEIKSHLKEKIFSLQSLTLKLIGFDNQQMIISEDTHPFIYNFDSIEFHKLVFSLINSNVLTFFNNNSKVNLLLKDCIINSSQIINTVSIFQTSKYGILSLYNVTFSNLNFINSSFLTLLSQNNIQTIKIKTLYLTNCSFINSKLFQFELSKFTILIEDVKIDQCKFTNSSIFIFISNFIIDKMILFNQIIVKNTEFYQSSIINSTDEYSLRIQNLNIQLNTIQESKAIRHLNNFSIFQIEAVSNKFIKSVLIDIIPSSLQALCNVNYIWAQRNLFQQSNFLKLSTSSELIVKMNNILFKEEQELSKSYSQSLLIKISCTKLLISDVKVINSNSLQVLQLTNVQEIMISNLIYENDDILSKIPISLSCVNSFNFQHQLLETIDCKLIKIVNAKIINQQCSDQALLSFQSNKQDLNILQERIDLENFEIIGNLLSKLSLTNFLSIVSIYSENTQQITLKDITFKQNIFHQHIDDPSETFASLIYIYSSKSQVDIINLLSSNNALTNSSSSFISINSKIVKIFNYTVFNHNILDQTLWSKYYEIKFEQNLEQNQINSIISQTFKFQNRGGACLIVASSFSCLNSSFTNILSQRSSLFEIKTQGQGNIILQNININSLNNDLLSMVDYSGSIYIYSENSLLDLNVNQISFENVFNKKSSSIFTIFPSQKENYINISNIQITNCISLINPIARIEFILDNSYQNKLFIQNVTILQNEEMWIDYSQKIGLFSLSEISDVINENSLIYVKGGDIKIINFQVEGIFITQLLYIHSPTKLLIQNMQINQIKTFHPLNLIEITLSQDIKSKIYFHSINVEKFQIYQIMNQITQHNLTKVNYSIIGCFIITQNLFFDDTINQDLSFDSLIKKLQLNAQQSGSLIYLRSTSSKAFIYFTFINILYNICNNFLKGLINMQMENNYQVLIQELNCIGNYIEQFGCLNLESKAISSSNSISISQSNFLNNNGTQGVAIRSTKVKLNLWQCLIMNNTANQAGGGLHLELSSEDFRLKKVSILHNIANEGGGIYFVGYSNLNSQNFIQSTVHFNRAIQLANNIVESPTHLVLQINSIELISSSFIINGTQTNILLLKPYSILEQGKLILAKYLLIPSNQQITKFEIFNPKVQTYQSYIENIQVLLKNSQNEMLPYIEDCFCKIEEYFFFNNQTHIQGPLITHGQKLNPERNSLDLGSLQFEFNPNQEQYSHFQININCFLEESSKKLQYFLKAKSFKCQLGEFRVDNGCQKCQSNQGYYSVQYNVTKCSIFDQKKFQNITSNSLQLLEGYWRPNYLSDQTEYCFKNPKYCQGGWEVGDNLCFLGHGGGLCEECDKYNLQGQGYFFKDQQSLTCLKCFQFEDSILPFILTSIWALLSILMTLKSIDKTNILFTQLKIRQKFNNIIFKLNQDHESILIKMLLNYFWIFSVIFSFNIKFTFGLSFIYQAGNPSFFMANNLDCYLSQISEIELIYSRIITMLILIILQLLIIFIGFSIYAIMFNRTFNKSMISATGLYLFVSNYAAIIKQFCSILSSRQISNINYIQGDVSLVFGYQNHYTWIYTFIIPGLGVFGCCIPFSLFFLMYIKKNQLDNVKLRRHICYLFNEYNPDKYFWEQIKLTKKTIIIIIMTYFEINILLKASLLGLCLLFYQLLAVKNKPYIISNLNNLDLQTGQICSIAIFLASAQYVSDQSEKDVFSVLLQILIMLLCIKLCSRFVFDIVRVYIRKYRVLCVSLLLKLFQFIKADFCLTLYLSQYKKQLIQKDKRLKICFIKLKQYLLQISKAQIKQQKQITTLMSFQSSVRVKLNNSDMDSRKLIKIELERLFETNN